MLFPPSSLLYTAEQVIELDELIIQHEGLSATLLMKRAGRDAFALLLEQWPSVSHIHIFCGVGNNAGDGYVLAALAKQRQLAVTVWLLGDSSALTGAAADAYQYAIRENVVCQSFTVEQFVDSQLMMAEHTVLVDALLGTGARLPLRDDYAGAVNAINLCREQQGYPVLAVDIPTGVNPNTADVPTVAIQADVTLSFIGQKQGVFTGAGRAHSGRRYFSDLGVDDEWIHLVNPTTHIINLDSALQVLPERKSHAHKGDCGHLLVVGGDAGTGYGYGGAPIMAAQMALRTGAGLVSLATRPAFVNAALARQPEMMVAAVDNGETLLPMLARATGFVIGPGLGRSSWSEQLFYHVLHQTDKPLVIDADALYLLAQPRFFELASVNHSEISRSWILTPHAGEAATLLGMTIVEVEADRFAAAQAIAQRYQATVILKGAGTLVVTASGEQWLCDQGNAGMASGGMGDVLSGLLGSLLVQGISADDAAILGVALHAQAADNTVATTGIRGLLATDLMLAVQSLLASS